MPVPAALFPESSSLSSVATKLTAHEEIESNVRAKLASYQSTGTNDHAVTILENFVKYLPQDGVRNISDDILGCGSSEELRSLANHLLTAVLMPMKAYGKTPIASPSLQFGAEDSVEEIAELVESSSRNDQAWPKTACLRQDNSRCVITGLYDTNEAMKNLSPSERQQIAAGAAGAAHIIPFSLGNFSGAEVKLFPQAAHCVVLSLTVDQHRNTATIWDAMYRYFPSICFRVNLSADIINGTNNAMTMIMGLHSAFRNF